MSEEPNKKYKRKKIAQGFFVTGTDTGVGKTLIASALSLALISRGRRVCAIKPIASGCHAKRNELFSDDALLLQRCSSSNNLSYEEINPFHFHEAVAPHLGAKKEGIKLSVATVLARSSRALYCNADYLIIEGIGGWSVPINDQETMADLAQAYGYPVVLVVGIKLGCINHALLTYKEIYNSGVKIVGWVANVIDNKMLYIKENIDSIRLRISAPLLGIVPYISAVSPEKISHFLFNFLFISRGWPD